MSNVAEYGSVTVTLNSISFDEFEYVVQFPVAMGNVPAMTLHVDLHPMSMAMAQVMTEVDGNVLGGAFQLSFQGETTTNIAYNSSASDFKMALESLASIGSVDITRSEMDTQHGFEWTVEFTSDLNKGDIVSLMADSSQLSASSGGQDGGVSVSTVADGRVRAGSFTLAYGGSTTAPIGFDASSSDFKIALESLASIPVDSVTVSRTTPDSYSYSWTVTFQGTHDGDLALLVADTSQLSGQYLEVTEVQTGTYKEVQEIAISASSSVAIDAADMMVLGFDGATPTWLLCGLCPAHARLQTFRRNWR